MKPPDSDSDRTAARLDRDLRVRAALAGCFVLAAAGPSSAESPLASHRWDSRLLVVFSASMDDSRMRDTLDLAAADADAFADRDLIVVTVVEGSGTLGGRSLSRRERDTLRSQFRVTADEFAVILVGKDGTEKLRLDRPPGREELFGLIDAMPMRKREMRATRPEPADEETR